MYIYISSLTTRPLTPIPTFTHPHLYKKAVARLLVLLWEHELDLLRHAHGVESDEALVQQLLEYTTRTLKVGDKGECM